MSKWIVTEWIVKVFFFLYVTNLRYAIQDENTLYLVLDLMVGGDLKYHLNNEKIFSQERSKFYAAEV